MNNLRAFKQKLAAISRLWQTEDYDTALAEVESLRTAWPGNAHLYVLWASLVQLQEQPQHELDEVKVALEHAVELERESVAALIELGHFLDNVEDDPAAAGKVYAEGVTVARQMLIDALIGQAKAYRQLGKHEEFRRCLLEILHLTRFETGSKRGKQEDGAPDIILESPAGHFQVVQLKGPYAEQIQELLGELTTQRSA